MGPRFLFFKFIFNELVSSEVVLPEIESFSCARAHHTASIWNNSVYIFGGAGTNNNLERLDTNLYSWSVVSVQDDGYSWTKLGDRPVGRYGHGAAVYQNKLYIFGGFDGETDAALNDIWSFDFISGIWTDISPAGWAPAPRGGHVFHFVNQLNNTAPHLLVFGGAGNDEVYFNDLWGFNLQTNQWKHVTPFGEAPAPRAFASSLVEGTNVWIYAGESIGDVRGEVIYWHDLWYIDTDAHLEFTHVDYPEDRAHPVARSRAITIPIAEEFADFTFYIMGGRDVETTLADVWSFDVEELEWNQDGCFEGYLFPTCVLDCSSVHWCHGHGVCLRESLTCVCEVGWENSIDCDFNPCDDWRGYSSEEMNEILLPKSIQSLYWKLDTIVKKLENIRKMLPTASEDCTFDIYAFANESYHFYQYCLVENLCEVTEGFEDVIGCDVIFGSYLFNLLRNLAVLNRIASSAMFAQTVNV